MSVDAIRVCCVCVYYHYFVICSFVELVAQSQEACHTKVHTETLRCRPVSIDIAPYGHRTGRGLSSAAVQRKPKVSGPGTVKRGNNSFIYPLAGPAISVSPMGKVNMPWRSNSFAKRTVPFPSDRTWRVRSSVALRTGFGTFEFSSSLPTPSACPLLLLVVLVIGASSHRHCSGCGCASICAVTRTGEIVWNRE